LLSYLRNWKVPFKDQVWPLIDRLLENLTQKITSPLALKPVELCATHVRRAKEAYLKEHPEEADSIHVVVG
jgi:hypothetical protein